MTFDETLLLENWCIHYHKTVWADNTRLKVESWKTADLLNMDSGLFLMSMNTVLYLLLWIIEFLCDRVLEFVFKNNMIF